MAKAAETLKLFSFGMTVGHDVHSTSKTVVGHNEGEARQILEQWIEASGVQEYRVSSGSLVAEGVIVAEPPAVAPAPPAPAAAPVPAPQPPVINAGPAKSSSGNK